MTGARRKLLTTAGAWAVAAACGVLFSFPVLNTVLTSLKTVADISSTPPKWVFAPTVEHYANVFYAAGYKFSHFLANSLLISLACSALLVVVCLPAAYSIVRFGIGRARLLPAAVSLRLLPPVTFAIPFFILYSASGLLDTRTGLVLVNLLANIPLGLLIFVSFIQELPQELEESAFLDGATAAQALRHIVFPLAYPGIGAVAILTFIWTWNEFLFALMLTINKATTVTVGASLFVTAWGVLWGDVAAAISVAVVPTLLFSFFVQRYLVRGITLGAVR